MIYLLKWATRCNAMRQWKENHVFQIMIICSGRELWQQQILWKAVDVLIPCVECISSAHQKTFMTMFENVILKVQLSLKKWRYCLGADLNFFLRFEIARDQTNTSIEAKTAANLSLTNVSSLKIKSCILDNAFGKIV